MTLRAHLHRLLAPAAHGDRSSLFVDRLIFALVALDLTVFAFASQLPSEISIQELGVLYKIEVAIVCCFAVEYLLRLWSCVEDSRFRPPSGGRLAYAMTPMALIDLVAALPALTLLPGAAHFVPASLSTVRAVRLVRLLRAVKLVRYSVSMQLLGRAIKRIQEELLAILFVMMLVALVGASVAHGLEAEEQPGAFGSFGQCLWWAVVTMTTVGYGDVVPITMGGRFLAGVLAIAGPATFAIPAGLAAAAFGEEMSRERRRRERQRDRERREREERLLEHLVEEAVHEALAAERGGSGATEAAPCPHCGQALPAGHSRGSGGTS